MTTFNGCRFLDAQLESIAKQTRLPNEIVIGDDRSTDGTTDVIEAFGRRHPEIPVYLLHNTTQIGSTRNFEGVLRRCTGNVVVFSDQDDIWKPMRLSRTLEAFAANPAASYVFSNGELIDFEGRLLRGTIFTSIDFTVAERERFRAGDGIGVLLRHNVVVGATMAVRRSEVERVLPIEPGWIHDYFIAFVLEVIGRGVALDIPLIQYRRHPIQQVGVAKNGLSELLAYARKQDEAYCRREAENFRRLQSRLLGLGITPSRPVIGALGDKTRFFNDRARMRAEPLRSARLLWHAWHNRDYERYSLGWKQLAVDVVTIASSWRSLPDRRRGR